jgi:hypothetical protein
VGGAGSAAVRKSDAVVAALAVLAVVATAVGGLSGDRWTEERTLRFAGHQQPLPPAGASAGPGGGLLNWTVPDNATSANVTVTVDFSGQAVRGGTATVSLRLTAPDGTPQPPATKAFPIPQGATSAQVVLNASAVWDSQPNHLRDTRSGGHTRSWDRPLQALVIVQAPSDLPVARYSFTASGTGTVSFYTMA